MGASLADVEGATLIRSQYIDALEKGNYSTMPGQIYVKLYVKSYASFLGMDPQQAAEMLDRELEEAEKSGEGRQELAAADRRSLQKQKIEQLRRIAARRRILMTALVLALLTALILVIYFLTGGTISDFIGNSAKTVKADEPIATTETAPVEPIPISTAAEDAGLIEPPVGFAHTLRIDFSDDCWIRAYADGAKVREGIWHNGSSLTIEAEQGIWVRLGNAGGAKLSYNGEDLGNPGLTRKVMDLSFPAGYEPF